MPTPAPAPKSRTRNNPIAAHPGRTALAMLVVALVVLVLVWDWNWLKGPIERSVEARTGRSLEIGGDLDVDLGRITTVRADALRFGNAAWSKEPTMAAADRAELRIAPLAMLFKGERSLRALRLSKPVLRLETGPDGGNWEFGEPGGEPVTVRRLWIDDGRMRFIDAPGRTDMDFRVKSREPEGDNAAAPVAIAGGGRWSGNAFTLEGTAESPLELQDADEPYRIDVRAAAGATRARARGTILDPFRLRDFDLRLALSGRNLEDLYPLLGIAAPPSPPYALDGQLRRDGDTWIYDRFTGKVGDSDLGGTASIATGGERLFLRANLVSKRLDFDDLAGFVGAAPKAEGSGNMDAELKALAAKQAASTRVLPDTPYELEKLRAMDADVRWKAQRINSPGLPIDDMDAHLKLDDGLLRLEPLNFGVAGGDVRSNIRMDASGSPIRTRAQIAARGLNLGQLFPDAKLTEDAVGRIGGDIAIVGSGNSVAKMLGSADGDIAIGMGRGRISNLLMELAGIDIYETLKYLIGKDKQVPIRCAFGDFAVADGVMTTRALAFDTTDTIIVGKGTVNLRDETLDLELRPRPKDRSILTLRSPLVAQGTFKNPSFRPDFARLGLRGAIALGLASIAPPAALLGTIDLGGGEDSGCGGQYAR